MSLLDQAVGWSHIESEVVNGLTRQGNYQSLDKSGSPDSSTEKRQSLVNPNFSREGHLN